MTKPEEERKKKDGREKGRRGKDILVTNRNPIPG